MKNSIVRCALLYAVLCSILRSSYPVLDEESYLLIAEQMAVLRPYDWSLPWPPYGDSYRYAHPPLFLLWIRCISVLAGDSVLWIKILAGLPFQLILGGCIGWFASSQISTTGEKCTSSRLRFQLLLFCSPVILLVGARSAMPDLMYASFGILAVAVFLGMKSWHGQLLCGVLLGISCWTKYPAFLLWIPILYASDWRAWRFIALGFAMTWGVGELWLWFLYGKWHLAVVLSTADHVGRGSVSGRTIGFLMRLLIACPALILIAFRFRSWLWVMVSAIVLGSTWVFLPSLSTWGSAIATLWVCGVVVALLWCVRKLDFFALWFISSFVGVCATHNFSSPRYLILAMIPLTILVERELRDRANMWLYPILAATIGLSAIVAHGEHRYAAETIALFQQLPKDIAGSYTGEWTFRAGARKHGLTLWKGDKGTILQPKQAVGGSLPVEYHTEKVYYGEEGYRMLLDRENSVGYYAETLGFWPMGWGKGPIEEFRVWTAH